jgi:hypothetical protein
LLFFPGNFLLFFPTHFLFISGGANIPALNEVLREFDVELGDTVLDGHFKMGDHAMYYASGTSITRFPKNNSTILIDQTLSNQGIELLKQPPPNGQQKEKEPEKGKFKKVMQPAVILGLMQTQHLSNRIEEGLGKGWKSGSGRLAVYGDSNCLDSTHMEEPCFWLLDTLLEYTMTSHVTGLLKSLNKSAAVQFTGGCLGYFLTFLFTISPFPFRSPATAADEGQQSPLLFESAGSRGPHQKEEFTKMY